MNHVCSMSFTGNKSVKVMSEWIEVEIGEGELNVGKNFSNAATSSLCKYIWFDKNQHFIFFFFFFLLVYIDCYRDIGPAVRVFANGPGDLGSIPGRVIPKTLKMELDTTLLNTQHYKVRFKSKVEQSWEWSSALPYTLV